MLRGVDRARWAFTFAAAVYNLVCLPLLLAEAACDGENSASAKAFAVNKSEGEIAFVAVLDLHYGVTSMSSSWRAFLPGKSPNSR